MLKFLTLILFVFSSTILAQTADEIRNYLQVDNSSPARFVKSVYKTRNFEPIFGKSGQWIITSSDLAAIETALKSHGLGPSDYQIPEIRLLINPANPSDLKTEIFLAENILKSIAHSITGRIDPRKISSDIKYAPKSIHSENIFATLSASQIATVYDQLAPKTRYYQNLKNILTKLRDIDSKQLWKKTELPLSPLSKGQSHTLIAHIKQKLNLLGYGLSNENLLYDEELDSALKAIQEDLSVPYEAGLKKKSKVWSLLNSDMTTRIRETELQMEKMRWLPIQLEARHAVANLANQMFYLQDLDLNPNGFVMEFKAINGQIKRKTPSMKDKIRSVILNPTWTVPMSIFFNDKLPILLKDPGYIERNNFVLIDMKTDHLVDPNSIDWSMLNRSNIDFQMVQNPSYSNALGVVKFPMTNSYSIYLHDTGERHLFKNNYRLLSSGCVRLERPLDFAEYLLSNTSWTRSRIEATVAKPGQKMASDTPIRLLKPLDIYILSLTVVQNGNKIQFFEDYYGHNHLLYKKLIQLGLLKN